MVTIERGRDDAVFRAIADPTRSEIKNHVRYRELAGKSAIMTVGGTGIGRGVTPEFAPTGFITGLGTHQFDGRLCLATEQTPRTPKS